MKDFILMCLLNNLAWTFANFEKALTLIEKQEEARYFFYFFGMFENITLLLVKADIFCMILVHPILY